VKRIAVIALQHETNTFALEQNVEPDGPVLLGEDVLAQGHPENWPQEIWIGGFIEEANLRPDIELVGVAAVNLIIHHNGLVMAGPYKQYQDLIIRELSQAGPLDGVYFALHGAMAVEAPYTDAEACLVRAARDLLGPDLPFVGTYDFHGIYTDWEVTEGLVPFPMDTNPHIDAYERGAEAARCIFAMLDGKLNPVTRRIFVPIIGPNIGQSTWSHLPEDEQRLPLYQLNQLRAELEETPGVINLTIQGGYGYADTPDTGMCVMATTDNNPELADKLATQLARELWAKREQIRTVRPIRDIDEGVKLAMATEGLVNLVDTGDDPGSACPADSPAILEALIRHGASDCAVSIRDTAAVRAGLEAGIGATITLDVGASIDQRFYKPLRITATVKHIDDGDYMITGPTHAGRGRTPERGQFQEQHVGPRVVLRIGDRIDLVCSNRATANERDYYKSAGVNLDEKQIVVVKSNQAHRASFDPIVDATVDLRTPGVSTVDYASLPYKMLPRPIYPIDLDMEWEI